MSSKITLNLKFHLDSSEKTLKIVFKDNHEMGKLFQKVCAHEKVSPNKVRFTYKNGRISKYETARSLGMKTNEKEPIFVHWVAQKDDHEKDKCPINKNCAGFNESETILVKIDSNQIQRTSTEVQGVFNIFIRKNANLEDLMIKFSKTKGYDRRIIKFHTDDGELLGAEKTAVSMNIQYGDRIIVSSHMEGG